MYLHTFYTWLLANIIHPVFLLLFVLYHGGPVNSLIRVDTLFTAIIFSGILSLPCLLIGWILLRLIIYSRMPLEAQFLLWLFTAPLLILLLYMAISLSFGVFDVDDVQFLLPAIGATFTVIVIRFKAFERLIYSHQTEDHESNLV